jgi:two-component system, response regulator YesN
MPYKVFFVEDEVVTREGIRDNVDWQANGFEFCGEATDGEMALPLLRTIQPDVLITDIKMPFMDGLQLSKLVRERMPWTKIIILSGHDEFEYAQKAINLGVTDYLLKPVTVQKLQDTLKKLASQLDREKQEQENLHKLQEQVEENRAALRERLLLKLTVGAISPTEAIEKGQMLGLDLVASYYQVAILKIEPEERSEQFDYDEYQRAQQIIANMVEGNPDIFPLKKDLEDVILIMKGSAPEHILEERDLLFHDICQAIAQTRYRVSLGVGSLQNRIADVCQSFVEALISLQRSSSEESDDLTAIVGRVELLKLDKAAVENYLRCGTRDEFDTFFSAYLSPLGESALKSSLIKNYIFVDVVLAAARLVNDLGGDIDHVIPELNHIESALSKTNTLEQLREQAFKILCGALAFRDSQRSGQYKTLVRLAKDYMVEHFSDPELSLNEVASQVNLSASHFSAVFSQETCQTFKEYLTEIRIKKAKELLCSTPLRSSDIAYQVGYNDPHYFSSVFKKNTGLSPIEFRGRA